MRNGFAKMQAIESGAHPDKCRCRDNVSEAQAPSIFTPF
jgi:hypothetical protein